MLKHSGLVLGKGFTEKTSEVSVFCSSGKKKMTTTKTSPAFIPYITARTKGFSEPSLRAWQLNRGRLKNFVASGKEPEGISPEDDQGEPEHERGLERKPTESKLQPSAAPQHDRLLSTLGCLCHLSPSQTKALTEMRYKSAAQSLVLHYWL